ncbi:MAG: DUF4783 domain-containing protein [Hydrotalea sp.]|jgi:hypothetical protein|nr:DUF4783 domain-containing protein [Hydrotalea sp.]
MKYLMAGWGAFAVVMSVWMFRAEVDDIVKALKSGNAESVAAHFDEFIDLRFPEKEEMKAVSKNQATQALKSFYKDNGIKGFELLSQREMSGTLYMAGKMLSSGKSFSVTLILRNKEGRFQIVAMRIN